MEGKNTNIMTSKIIQKAKNLFIENGVAENLINNDKIRVETLLYMLYWIERLKNNSEEQNIVKSNLVAYLQRTGSKMSAIAKSEYDSLIQLSCEFVQQELIPVQTVDLVIEKQSAEDREVLLFGRQKFPKGICLPGGLVQESDESNPLNIDARSFAALRVAAQKVLMLQPSDTVYKKDINERGEVSYIVENGIGDKKVIIHPKNIYGYSINENLKSVIRPSDPRHLVDTIGFKCELITNSDLGSDYFWESKKDLLESKVKYPVKEFAFNHHKEIIFHTLAKTSLEREITFNEKKFIRDIIDSPLASYEYFSDRFKSNNSSPYTSFPELFPAVNKMLTELFTPDMNDICENNKVLLGLRDKVVNSLRHVSLKNRTFCPYLPTIQAIFGAVEFFDIVARHKKNFYEGMSATGIVEHNPKEKTNAPYHMYKYEYRMNELLAKIPKEIVIPTFSELSATDLMKVRGVPIRFVGLSKDFIYVDEFEQSPEEFLMHDINHSYRMSEEDDKYIKEKNISHEKFVEQQNSFIEAYLQSIRISLSDNEEEREIKKIKKIILFEITHEDAKPFLPDIVLSALVRKEGGETKFEMPIVDERTGYMDIVDVLDTEISTLSYVRNKLQCGFYDKVDNQNTYIVSPQYRHSEFIAKAAMSMINELSIIVGQKVKVDYEYIMKRVCSVGPDNIYSPVQQDSNVHKYSSGAQYLNPKRYRSNQKM